MRNAFYEYYGLSKEEYEKLWNNALVVFDTNVLLSLYRLQLDARADMLSAMKGFKDRLWMPFQVGYEYHERRLEEACRPIASLRSLDEKVAAFAKEIEDDFGKNPYIKDYRIINRALKSLGDRISKQLEDSLSACPNFMREDTILYELTKLYDGKVGEAYSDKRLKEIFTTGEERYNKKVPPGYKDTNKKTGDRHRFGDLIIWFQILEKSKNDDRDILFVTDDKKEDWWQLHNGDKIGPRRELIIEFRKETGNHLIGFYTPDRFLSVANERKTVSVKKKTIEDVKYSDIVGIGLESFLGESTVPGQVSMGSLLSSPFGALGESDKDNLSFMPRMDNDRISLTGAGSTALSDSIGLFGTSAAKPKIKKPGKLEMTPSISEAETFPIGDGLSNTPESSKDAEEDNIKEN